MKVKGEYTFEAPPERVWKGLMDPEVMAATMPGAEKLELVGKNQYQSDLNIKVGPVQGKFRGRIELENIDPPNAYTMKVDGQGPQGFVNATARIEIAAAGDQTRMTYEGDAQVGGRIASVGQRLMESSAKVIIKQSLEGLNTTLKAQIAAETAGGDPAAASEIAAPSATEFAASVTKEVARDLVPTPVWIVAGILLLLVFLYFILG
jgi:carbon monoxide dehydrogenase subunit G